MNKLKKIFFVLVVAGLLDLAVVPAEAQFTRGAAVDNSGSTITTTSLPRQGRKLGHAETGGEVVLTFNDPGFIPDGSSVDFLFGVSIGNGEDGTDFSGNVFCNGVACPGVGAIGSDSVIEVGQVGNNIVRVSFRNTAVPDAFAGFNVVAADTITLFGVRLNANAAGGANVEVTMSGVSAIPSTNPITFTDPQRTVLVPQDELLAGFSDNQTILTCQVGDTTVETQITERFPAALATELQEEGFSDTAGTTAEPVSNAVFVNVTLSGVPAGLTVTANDVIYVGGAATLTLTLDGDDEVDSDGSPIVFEYEVTASDTAAVEKTGNLTEDGGLTPLDFLIEATSGNSIPVVGTPREVKMTISLGPEDDVDEFETIPRFLENNIVDEDVVAIITDCVTRLLYSWGVNIAGYETGIAISNTSEDDLSYETSGDDETSAVAQSGPCVLTGYPSADADGDPTSSPTVGTPVQFTTGTIPAGSTEAFVISGLPGFSGFRGYILAVCNFLNAHSFAFITDGFGSAAGPGLAQGFQALVISNTGRVLADGEARGH